MSDFVHLHVHSEYSLLDGLSRVEEMPVVAKKLGMDTLALTDHGSMYGAIAFYKQAKAAGIKPIIGVETYMAARSRLDKQPGVDKDQFHLGLLAKNEQGYKNLLRLTTIAHLEGFYYKPRIDFEILRAYHEGLICLSGCLAAEIPSLLLANQEKKAYQKAQEFQNLFGEDYYLELQIHPAIPDCDRLNKKLVEMSATLGIPVVATNDVHYLREDDAEAHEVLLCVQTQHTMLERNRPLSLADSPDFYLKSPKEMESLFVQYPEAIKNTRIIADKCNLEIPLGKWILPPFEVPEGFTPHTYLADQVQKKAPLRFKEVTEEIKERIEYELSIITKKGYSTYFLIVADFINWAKSQGILTGPGRGSAAGSVISYILGITGIDPFYFKLPFERFLNPYRPSPPDIDLDFADDRRDEVIEYVRHKYGEDKVAQIITFGTMEAKAAVRDVGRALGMPYAQPDRIAKMIPFGAQGFPMSIAKAIQITPDLKTAYDTEPDTKKLLDLAQKLEGVARHSSVHAAGVVIADKPLVEYTPLQKEARAGKIVTQYDMYNVGEDGVGLLKMDFLGLRNLTIMVETLKFVLQTKDIKLELNSIPLDDAATYTLLSEGQTSGIFQLESSGMRRYVKELKPTSIFDLMAMVALYRPGPMKVIPEFIERKHDPSKVVFPHPNLQEALKESYGLICYQDDVLLTSIHLAGYSWEDADKLRKAVGKKIPAEMKKQEEKFIAGCKKQGISGEKALEIFHLIEPFAGYGFNKAHAACYATIAYQTAYLKTHYPVEFMTAVLTAESRASSGPAREERLGLLIEECKRMGIELMPPNVNKSQVEFTIEKGINGKNGIRFGLSAIKNVGTVAIESILLALRRDGPFISLRDFLSRVDLGKVNKKTLESLTKAGAFDTFGKRASILSYLALLVEEIMREKKAEEKGQIGMFEMEKSEEDPLPEMEEFSKAEMLKFEKELFGFYLTEHPLTPVLSEIANKVSHQIGDLNESDVKSTVVVGGVILSLRKIITKSSNAEMAFVRLSDLSGSIELVVFPKVYTKTKHLLLSDAVVIAKGRVDERDDRLTMIVDDIYAHY